MKYSVGDLTIDTGTQVVSRAGDTIALPKLSYDLLLVLVRAAPNLVSLDELMRLVWPGIVVSPETVSQRIKLLRDALGDDPREPRYIAGLRGRGYQFVAAVKELEAEPAAAESPAPRRKSRRNWLLLTAVLVVCGALAYLVAGMFWILRHPGKPAGDTVSRATAEPAAAAFNPPPHSIAVLPFVNLSGDKDQEYFSDGLSEELIDMLTKVTDLRVPAHTSSFYFKGKQSTINDIAKVLRVAHVLEGSVRRSGKHLRITARLVRADDGYHVWSETYDRQLDDIFKVQDDIATAVVAALKVSLLGHTFFTAKGPQNIEAYNLYLQARSIFLRPNSKREVERAADYTRKALAADAQYAAAWAFLARVLSYQADIENLHDGPVIEEGRRAVRRALELDPELADAHAAAARIYTVNLLDPVRAEPEMRQALAIDPNNSFALALSADLYANRGQFDKAMDLNDRSINSDPANAKRYWDRAGYLLAAGKYSDSMKTYNKVLELNPGFPGSHTDIGAILLAEGDPAAGLAEMDRETDQEERLCNQLRGLALDALGRRAEADSVLNYMVKSCASITPFGIGELYASRGEVDQAFSWFDRAYQQHDSNLLGAKVDPFLKNVQSDPRFTVLLTKMGLAD
jgi:TolB-like protein/DNA-binding winged helix-turn-helix (wHTH) protein/Tfp pilus assembly protein PilF